MKVCNVCYQISVDEVVGSEMAEDELRQDLQQIKELAAKHEMEIASRRDREWGWDLTRGEFVTAVQRRPVQFLDYLQGLLLLVLHPPQGVPRWWWDSWKTLILQCKYIHIVRKKKKAGKLWAAGEVERHCPLSLERPAAALSPHVKKMDSAAFPESSPMLGHLNV